MAVGYRSSSTTAATDDYASTVAVPVPSGAAAGDIAAVGIVRWEATSPAITPPAGFTLLTQAVNGNEKLAIFWKRLTGADTGTYTFTWSGSQYTGGQCVLITGGLAAGDPIGTNFNTATGNAGTVPTTTVSPSYAPFLAHFVSHEDSRTHTPATSFTEVQDGSYLSTAYRIPGASGSQSAANATLGGGASLLCTALVAVEPAAGGGTSQPANTAAETDSALALPRSKRRAAGIAGETDSSLPVARAKRRTANLATETDASLVLARAKRKAIGIASETDAALAIGSTSGITQPIGTAATTELAMPFGKRLARAIGTAWELDSAGAVTQAAQLWRLVHPSVVERFPIRGSLSATMVREKTVFGDESGLFTVELGQPSEGTDEYGAIPFGTRYIWHGGHVNTTDDPAIKNLWLAHGFEVENVVS